MPPSKLAAKSKASPVKVGAATAAAGKAAASPGCRFNIKAFARRGNAKFAGDASGKVTKQNLVSVQYRAQLKDIMGELQAVRVLCSAAHGIIRN